MTRYAADTTVSPGKSREEIERTLTRYGADGFMYGLEGSRAALAFRMAERHVKFVLPMPDRDAKEFTHTPARRNRRNPDEAMAAYEKAVRQRWRALALVIKAKLEAVESGITTFEEEFLAHTLLPNGQTVGDFMLPQVESAYETGKMPPLLSGPKSGG